MTPRRCPTCGREPTRAFCKAYCSPDPFPQIAWRFAAGSLLITAFIPLFVVVAWPSTSLVLVTWILPRVRRRFADSFARLGVTLAFMVLGGLGATALCIAAAYAGLTFWTTLWAG